MAFFLNDENEDPWVRRHIPGTLAAIPSTAAIHELSNCLATNDGFIRFKLTVKYMGNSFKDFSFLACNLGDTSIFGQVPV